MDHPIRLKTTAPPLLITLTLLCSGLLPRAQAVVPPPDGGYPNFTTAEGQNALQSLTTGSANTAVGWFSLFSDTTGSFNTATGAGALLFNTADQNTAFGTAALLSNATGANNTAFGVTALVSNTEGFQNTANGAYALYSNTTGRVNTATGANALDSNTTGNGNTATGWNALYHNTTGANNTAMGPSALFSNTIGVLNTATGPSAGFNATTGNGNVYLGGAVLGVAGESDHTYIRNINTTSVNGAGTDTVTVNLSTGLLGHLSSSRRYKEDIKAMQSASETLYRFKPVSYRYKKEIDPSQSLDYGLIAEDVAKIDPNLANRNRDGQIESVRYNAINAMLLNEFLKEHRKVKELEANATQQHKEIAALAATVKEQAAQIQRVSAQLEASKPAPQVVNNP